MDAEVVSDDEEAAAPKQEDDGRDELAVRALEHLRAQALEQEPSTQQSTSRKRSVLESAPAQPTAKRRKVQQGAVLLDTGQTKQVCSSTSLVNYRLVMFVSQHLPFSPGPLMGLKRGACSAATLRDSQILVLGGAIGHTAHDATEVLMLSDSNKMSVAPGPRLRVRRREPATIRLDGGRFMVIGGHDGSEYLNSTEVLSLKTNEFVPGPYLNEKRGAASVALLGTTHVIVVGGRNSSGSLASTEILDLSHPALSFRRGPSMKMRRAGLAVAALDRTRLIVIGGHDNTQTHSTTEILYMFNMASDPPGMSFIDGPFIGLPRSHFAAVTLNAGNLLLIGGHDGYTDLDGADVLNLATMEITSGPKMAQRRRRCAAAVLPEGRVLVAGGNAGATELNSTEVLNTRMYTFAPAPWMRVA